MLAAALGSPTWVGLFRWVRWGLIGLGVAWYPPGEPLTSSALVGGWVGHLGNGFSFCQRIAWTYSLLTSPLAMVSLLAVGAVSELRIWSWGRSAPLVA